VTGSVSTSTERASHIGSPTSEHRSKGTGTGTRGTRIIGLLALVMLVWLVVFAFFVCGATTNGLIGTHLISACADHGYTEVEGAGLLAAISGMLAGSLAPQWYATVSHPHRIGSPHPSR